METNDIRRMGSFGCRSGLQAGIYRDSKFSRHKANSCKERKFELSFRRSKFFNKKRCYRNCATATGKSRFLQYLLPCSKKRRNNETSNKSETPQQFSEKTTFQNGHNEKSLESSDEKRLGNFNRSERRIHACSDLSETQKISSVLHSRNLLPMESSMFRTNVGSSSFYKNRCNSSSILTSKKHTSSRISGRLVNSKPVKEHAMPRSRFLPKSPLITRFLDQCNKIGIDSNTNDNIHRRNVSVTNRESVSSSRQSSKNKKCNYTNAKSTITSQRLSSHSGVNGIVHRSSSICQTSYEANSVTSVEFLETGISRIRESNTVFTTSKWAPKMVVKFSQHFERGIFCTKPNILYNHNRCIITGLRGPFSEPNISRDMVYSRENITHQLSRVGSSIPNTETFSNISEKQGCSNPLRQFHSSSIHKQTRWNKVIPTLPENMESVELGNRSEHSLESSSFSRQIECSSRPSESSKNTSHRMDTEKIDSPRYFSEMGVSSNRSVCVGIESPNTDILFMVSKQSSISIGCNDDIVGEHVSICVSPVMSCTKSSEIHATVSKLSNNLDSPHVAKKTLVHGNSTKSSRLSNRSSSKSRHVVSTKNKNISSKSRNAKIGCMESIDKNFSKKGFSQKARELIKASWRAGTRKDYTAKFNKFNSWCSERKIDTYDISLTQIADFLTQLYDQGLQYRTIAGYRSMLSAVIRPIDNSPVGQHPYIIRLLKGVFNSRPPKVHMTPEWDLKLVLTMLENQPFEPLKDASLKGITLKTIFLIAISTFRRCSDLQSLKLGEDSVKVQSKGITFIRQGLSKQDRLNHLGSLIFVPSFTDNKKLDPKRALHYYLKKTEVFRKNPDGSEETKLFLSMIEPHKPVSSQTISKWIVEVIKMAYNSKHIKVKAHSTRAIGPSWALFNGASLKSVLDSADWSKESTFTRFYLRDVNQTAVLKK